MDNMTLLPAGLQTFPEVLQKNGYRTAMIGKWHMGGSTDEPCPGFDRWVSFRGQGPYRNPTLNTDGTRLKVQGYTTDILTEEALRFIGANADRPFLLYLGHKAVHGMFEPAPRHQGLYTDVAIPRPKTMADTEENYRGKPAWVGTSAWHGVDGMYDKRIDFDRFYRDYCRTLMALDESVGRVMDELERRGLANDTLVVYMGDNGFMFGEHGLIDKRTMYEPSIRIPMIARCPDLFAGGRRVDGMALNIDIASTMLDAAGAPAVPTAHGRSLLPLLHGGAEWRTEFLYEYFWEEWYPHTPTVHGIRTDRYSLMQYRGIWDYDELYDVRKDPDQTSNLLAGIRVGTGEANTYSMIRDPEMKKLVGDLRERRQKILAATGGRQ